MKMQDGGEVIAKTNEVSERPHDYPEFVARLTVGLSDAQLRGNSVPFVNDFFLDRKSTRLNSSHLKLSRMPSSA